MKFLSEKFSRRTLVRNAGFAAGVGLLGVAGSENGQTQAVGPAGETRALALIGDRHHFADYIQVSLNKVFKDLNIPIDYTVEYDKISADRLKNYRLFLILRDGVIWPNGYLGPDAWSGYSKDLENASDFPNNQNSVPWITPEQGAAMKNFVSQGNGFYALHCSSHISLSSKDYRDMMGGAFLGHPPLRPFRVRPTQNAHPITQGIGEFMVNDEQHYVAYDKDPKYQILEAENTDGLSFGERGTKSNIGWAYEYGQGRVVFTALGHTNHAMWVPQYLEIQKRSVKWLLKQT